MRIWMAVSLALICAVARDADAKDPGDQAWRQVKLHMITKTEIPRALLEDSQAAATVIYAKIHIRLTWTGDMPQASQAVVVCAGEPARYDLAVEIVPHAPPDLSNAALGMAITYQNSAVRIVIFYDRVQDLYGHHAPHATILGHILAHEITHVLQGVPRHSLTGIMRARWTDNDLRLMGLGALMFTGEDVRLIRLGVETLEAKAACRETSSLRQSKN